METLPNGRSVFGSLFDMLFPPVCPLCEKAIVIENLCQGCLSGFDALRIASPLCTRCGVPFALSSSKDHLCGRCCKDEPPFVRSRSVFGYDKAVLDAIHSLKYRQNVGIAPALGRLIALSGYLPDEQIDMVAPVPLHPSRLRKRGFNHSLLLAKPIAEALHAKIDYMGLKKIRSTKDQIGLNEKERAENMQGAFAALPGSFYGKTVLIVDDVYTTGATIRACSSTLVKAGAKVYVITLARTAVV